MNQLEKLLVSENRILNNTPITILLWAIGGTLIFYIFKLSMNKDSWFWFFSSTAQTFAAFIAFISMFFIFRMQLSTDQFLETLKLKGHREDELKELVDKTKKNMQAVKDETRQMLLSAIPIILISIILIPFGSLEVEDSWMLDIWNIYKLKSILIFSMVGYCFSTVYKIIKKLIM
jgi:hypothetical protein